MIYKMYKPKLRRAMVYAELPFGKSSLKILPYPESAILFQIQQLMAKRWWPFRGHFSGLWWSTWHIQWWDCRTLFRFQLLNLPLPQWRHQHQWTWRLCRCHGLRRLSENPALQPGKWQSVAGRQGWPLKEDTIIKVNELQLPSIDRKRNCLVNGLKWHYVTSL